MAKKALLMILDGWGNGKHGKGDVIYNTPTPYLDYLNAVSDLPQSYPSDHLADQHPHLMPATQR